MDIQADIKWIQEELNKVEDKTLLDAIKNILLYRAKVTQQKRVSIELYNLELEESEAEIEAGNHFTSQEARKIAKKWGR